MAKINLLDFSDSYRVDSRGTKGLYWSICNVSKASSNAAAAGFTDVGALEEAVIDRIMAWSDWKVCPEYELLSAYFKKGGKLTNTGYFYTNLEKIKAHNHYRGCDLVYAYAKNVIKGRLPSEAEGKFLKELWSSHYAARSAYKYAKYVIRNRLPVEYEKGCGDLDYLGFLESKGHDISDVLINSSNLSFYYYRKYCYLPEVVHNFMIAMQLSGDYYANSYFRQRNKDDKLIRSRLKMMDGSKTVSEVIKDMKG